MNVHTDKCNLWINEWTGRYVCREGGGVDTFADRWVVNARIGTYKYVIMRDYTRV